ncbi:MAG: bifunctional phosphopantothenoylcysteine decarboxylase/phosphopantothenate--cysteine ligase CoaBC [Actinomycetaceae bacterium]|nr:bifunctional phosphopantothenoylcysteine decarboxylase/phosphopantothenate--cysteine ligase CoaBC [Actinomycetaceae bacterium]
MGSVVLGVTGSVAAFKAVELLRTFTKNGHKVRVIPTESSLEFVGKSTWESLSGHSADTGVFDGAQRIDHVATARDAKLIVIAPATADFLARARAGMANDLLTSTVLAADCPIIAAPAMHPTMWLNPATQENVDVLRKRGWHFVGPTQGVLADGHQGWGRLAETQEIFARATHIMQEGVDVSHDKLAGRKVLVTAGGTREPWDPVRFVGNYSTGRQGCALAQASQMMGAQVTLVSAHVEDALIPSGVTHRRVETAQEMANCVLSEAGDNDIIVMAAAVADYRPVQRDDSKMSKEQTGEYVTLEMERTTDILSELVAARRSGQVIVGFAAHTGSPAEVRNAGVEKARRKQPDLLAVNTVGSGLGFGDVENSIEILDATGESFGNFQGSKLMVSQALMQVAARCLEVSKPEEDL